jgi:peptidoglycan/LPS O-acetylase OafA/YrhL
MPILLSRFLDACRWVGALLVLAIHASNAFINLSDIMKAPHEAPVYVWWFFVCFEFGHQAIVGFFVISGYLVGGAAIAHLLKRETFLTEYLIHRFARVYIVLVPAVALTALVDGLGRFLAPDGIYQHPNFKDHWSASYLLNNLASLQDLVMPAYGSNGPLWSLAYEFWYYVTFPLIMLALIGRYPLALRVLAGVVGAAVVVFLTLCKSWFGVGYAIWALAAVSTLAQKPLVKSRWLAIALYLVFLIPTRLLVRGALLDAHPWMQDAVDVIAGALFINVMLTLRFAPQHDWRLLQPVFHKTLADFTFSLYCTHMPLLIFARAMADAYIDPQWAVAKAGPSHWIALICVVAFCVTFGYGFSRLTEANTSAMRKFLRKALGRAPHAPTRS